MTSPRANLVLSSRGDTTDTNFDADVLISGRTSHISADFTVPPDKGPILGSATITGLDLRHQMDMLELLKREVHECDLTIVATLGYAGSAAAMYWLLRRHGASVLAGALGGAVFGFSPGMVNASVAHYGMQFAVLVPLMIEAVLSIFTGRGRPFLVGAWLGVLAAAQLFTGEEMVSDVAIASLVLVAVLVVSRPSAVRARLPKTPRSPTRCSTTTLRP